MPSALLPASFVGLSCLMLVFWALALRRVGRSPFWPVGVASLIAALTCAAASQGFFSVFEPFPRVQPLFVLGFVGVVVWGVKGSGRALAALPVSWLVGFQSFRILVELAIHEAVGQGVAPPQMTWTGMNWDLLVGVSAAALLPVASRLPRWALLLWNTLSLGLLVNVVVVATLSMPGPLQQITPDNDWIGLAPYIWLPQVLVGSALLGHVLLYVKLLRPTPDTPAP